MNEGHPEWQPGVFLTIIGRIVVHKVEPPAKHLRILVFYLLRTTVRWLHAWRSLG